MIGINTQTTMEITIEITIKMQQDLKIIRKRKGKSSKYKL